MSALLLLLLAFAGSLRAEEPEPTTITAAELRIDVRPPVVSKDEALRELRTVRAEIDADLRRLNAAETDDWRAFEQASRRHVRRVLGIARRHPGTSAALGAKLLLPSLLDAAYPEMRAAGLEMIREIQRDFAGTRIAALARVEEAAALDPRPDYSPERVRPAIEAAEAARTEAAKKAVLTPEDARMVDALGFRADDLEASALWLLITYHYNAAYHPAPSLDRASLAKARELLLKLRAEHPGSDLVRAGHAADLLATIDTLFARGLGK